MIDKKRLEHRNPDAALKKLVEHADCFCDVVNYFLEEGEKITPDQVESFEEKNLYRSEKGLKQTERDVVKIVKGIGEIRVVIGVENQCYEDTGMPLRLMCYDGLTYYRFYREMKDDKSNWRYPPAVMTFVFNFSRIPMNGKSIRGLMDPSMPEWVKNLASDYTVHSIDVGVLQDSDWHRLGNGTIGQLVKLLKMKDEFLLFGNVPHLDDLADAFEQLTGEDFAPRMEDDPSGGGVMLDFPNAVENVRRIKEEYRAEGRNEGKSEKELDVIRNLLRMKQPLEMIAAALGKTIEEVESIIEGILETEKQDEGN